MSALVLVKLYGPAIAQYLDKAWSFRECLWYPFSSANTDAMTRDSPAVKSVKSASGRALLRLCLLETLFFPFFLPPVLLLFLVFNSGRVGVIFDLFVRTVGVVGWAS